MRKPLFSCFAGKGEMSVELAMGYRGQCDCFFRGRGVYFVPGQGGWVWSYIWTPLWG